MNVEHPDAEPGCGPDGTCDGVRDVVKLQIEEHAVTARRELLDEPWSCGSEQAAADLEATDGSAQAIGHRPRVGHGVYVQGDEKLLHLFQLPVRRIEHYAS